MVCVWFRGLCLRGPRAPESLCWLSLPSLMPGGDTRLIIHKAWRQFLKKSRHVKWLRDCVCYERKVLDELCDVGPLSGLLPCTDKTGMLFIKEIRWYAPPGEQNKLRGNELNTTYVPVNNNPLTPASSLPCCLWLLMLTSPSLICTLHKPTLQSSLARQISPPDWTGCSVKWKKLVNQRWK